MRKSGSKRISAVVALIDTTTYVDRNNGHPLDCIIMVTEHVTGDDKLRLPRIPLSDRIMQAGPETLTEYVREELGAKIGFEITNSLSYREQLTESGRKFLIFTGNVSFTVATDSLYDSVQAKCLEELQFFNDRVSPMHHRIATDLLARAR